jgi:transcriptional regulator with XRE-family HTH domain
MPETLTPSLARTVAEARTRRGLSVSDLARASGVSRAMVSKVERGDVQPTAVLLGRLAGALGLTLSELVARAERDDDRLARAADQPVWRDPGSGYLRRALSPTPGGPLELVEIELPAGCEVGFPADAYAFIHQQVWVLEGTLGLREGAVEHRLDRGDCLQLGAPSDCVFANPGTASCRYLVALARR